MALTDVCLYEREGKDTQMVVRRLSLCAVVSAACVIGFTSTDDIYAQSNISPDRAAGRMVDSLFDPRAPERLVPNNNPPAPPRRGVKRPALKAKLVRNSNARDGAPAYALVDRYGGILRYVEPVDKIKLEPYVGRIVGVRHDTGDTLLASQLAFPPLTQQSAVAARGANTNIRQAAFQEPIPAGEPDEPTLLEPTPADSLQPTPADGETYTFDDGEYIDMGDGQPMYMGEGRPIYDDGFGYGGCPDCESGMCSLHVRPRMRSAGPQTRAYAHGEYLLWWIDGMNVPPLVTTSTDPADGGVLPNPGLNDNPTTSILYGGDPILEDARHGFRVLLGAWVDEDNRQALEGDYLFLGKLEETFIAEGVNGNPIISRPFFDFFPPGPPSGLPPQENAQQVSSADLDGRVTVRSTSEFQGAGFRLRHNLCRSGCADIGCGCGVGIDCGLGVDCGVGVGCGTGIGCISDYRYVDFIAGFRWYSLDEQLGITEDLVINVEPPGDTSLNGTGIVVMDQFRTDNDFYGGELGFDWGIERGRFSVNLLSKLAIGANSQRVRIDGSTQTFPPGVNPPPPAEEGGLLALPSNIGRYDRDRFSMIPELNVNVGYQLTQRCKLRVGYTILYWTNVLRPGDQIDREINSTLLPGDDPSLPPLRPLFAFNETNALVQGLNVGAEFCW